MSHAVRDRGWQRLAVLMSLLLVAGVVGFAGSVAFAAGATTVRIGTELSPKDITVAPGTRVTWTSTGGGDHRLESTSGPDDFKSDDIGEGDSWSFTFTAEGSYSYLDDRNKDSAALHGTVTVATGAPGPGPGAGPGAGPAAPPAPMTASVGMAGKSFNPSTVTVAVGGTVTWTNDDSTTHNVTSSSGAFKSPSMSAGATFTFTFTAPGTYSYTCTLHGGMNGTVIVPSATGAVPPPAPPVAPPAAGNPNAPLPVAVPAAPGKPGQHTIAVSDVGFTPATLQARAGDTVTWVNKGARPHTATAAGGAFDLAMEPGASVSTVLQAPGTIDYICTYHPDMIGSIVVSEALPGVVIAPPPKATAPGKAAGAKAAGGKAAAGSGKTKTYQVQVGDNTFSPRSLKARVGDTVVWTNTGEMPHTVTAGDGSFDRQLAPGQQFSYALRATGTVPYVCTYHPGMDGTLVVGPALAGVAVPPPNANTTGGGGAAAGNVAAAPAPASTGKTKTYEITAQEMSFTPAMQEARVGDTISWVNVGAIPHTVTAADGSFDKTLAPGERFNLVLRKEGTIDYVCTFHPGMDGMLMVGPALAGVAVPADADAGTGDGAVPLAKPSTNGTATTFEVQVKDNSFTPAIVEARVGDTISWINIGKVPHTVTAPDGSFDKELAPGERYDLVLTEIGTIDYVCTPHKQMFGRLVVSAAPAGATDSPVRTLGAVSPVAVTGVGTGWLLIIGLIAVAQLRARAASPGPRRVRRRPAGDPS